MRLISLFLATVALQLGGCAAFTKNSEPLQISKDTDITDTDIRPAPEALIATDFVSALRQIPSVSPIRTTVGLLESARNDAFTQAMEEALDSAGYGSRWVHDNGSQMLFQYRTVVENAAASASQVVYEIAIGAAELRRTYLTDTSQRVRPLSPLYVRGVDASNVVLDNDIFENTDISRGTLSSNVAASTASGIPDQQQAASTVAGPSRPAAQIENTPRPSLGLQNSSALRVPSDANPLNAMVANSSGERTLSLPLIALPREQNVFDLGGSNFEDLLAGRVTVVEQVLTFANDSMRLGNRNKLLVEKMVQRFDPATDVFSVLGCSMGPTQVRGGNAALALGRAGRVVEALRFAGVADSQILDEGCWAGDGSIENLPRRGVVISLNRKA